ncbi:ArnT family glycosyltransferase [Sphingomonas jatrophae]|uniref:Dolichyl-phosphate-mannose-protein mannosyltransferase n=1 Tax=Sphingomonas jatrophae TaxID=1166337 RepID=A0A1I6KZ91_9SPHN|nr:glycosyltransferase family 39 protein [Sphingomonas jatrophae]SFR96539.1 Dolichyl-phosphate-mannose-protein mannosyltransferase [Sphingomonas jatrophae]
MLAQRRSAIAVVVLAAAWILLQSLAQKPDHDESQYVAGAVLALQGMPFRDFMLLQPPLHAWLLAPLAWAWPTDMFIAMRLATGLLALATLAIVYRTQRAIAVQGEAAFASTLLMGCCASFQFCAGVVRNDMAAVLLMSLGIWAMVLKTQDWDGRSLVAGLAFGLAVATKLSIAPVAAAAGLHLLLDRRERPRALPMFAVGSAIGLAPAAFAFVLAPEAFRWGVFTFAATAPFDWYGRIGAADELTMAEKASDLVGYMLVGPALIVLLLVACWAHRTGAVRAGQGRLLILLILGGIAGAALPTPTHKQYLLPILPPLFMALGLVLADGRRAAVWQPLMLVSALIGLAPAAVGFALAGAAGLPALAVDDTGDWVGSVMRARGSAGVVASLSPERAADSGFPLDPRFATGPFVFRSGALLSHQRARRLALPTPRSLEAILRAHPPAAILVGYERVQRREERALDLQMAAVARRMAWRPVRLPDGQGTLWLRPKAAS